MSGAEGVVVEDGARRLYVEARQFARWPRATTPSRLAHASPSVVLLPMRAEVAVAVAEARRLGKRFYLVTRE